MQDSKYCYSGTDVLVNKLNIKNNTLLFEAEKQLTFIRLQELQSNPIEGNYDFDHLKRIHKYIFQDIYDWAGELRTVEIGKGNLFCTTVYLEEYGNSIFNNFYIECYNSRLNFNKFIKNFSKYYADLNALHPFREGNGRTQREFARLICKNCGYILDLSCTSHFEMLEASVLSFNKADNSKLEEIFKKAIIPIQNYINKYNELQILSYDDLNIPFDISNAGYEYYEEDNKELINKYNTYYKERMNNK